MQSVLVKVFSFVLTLSKYTALSERYDVHKDLGNTSHTHEKSYSVAVMPEVEPPYSIVFIFGTFALAALVRQLWVRTRVHLPHSVVLFAVGALVGWLAYSYAEVHVYTEDICNMSPKYLMMIFLPVLIFRTAFCIDAHAFKRGLREILLMSIFGFLMATLLTAVIAKGLYFGRWSWELAVMFAAIASTSYPQEVIILLREQGQSKQLSMLLEGEGLLVDGAAIVVFNIFLGYVTGYVSDALHIFLLCLKFLFGGPALGYIIGKLTAYAVVHIFCDAMSAATITLVVAFVSYYVAEEVLGVSGVLCLVVLGVVLSAERMSLSSEVDTFVQLFWELLSFFSSALLFMMAGVLIFEDISAKIALQDILNSLVLYLICFISRAAMCVSVSLALRCWGARLPPQSVVVLVCAHLRGAVCLCLALVVDKAEGMDEEGSQFLIYVSSLVMLTQVINGSSLQYLMKSLGMLEVSLAKRANMNSAIKYLMMTRERSLNMVKMDRHLAGANWMIVQEATQIRHPYKSLSEEGENGLDTFAEYRIAVCPDCKKEVPTEPTKSEYIEMQKEANLRILNARKVSYRQQYEHGLLSKEATHVLVTAVEIASDREVPVMEVDDLRGRWRRTRLTGCLRRRLVGLMVRADAYRQPPRARSTRYCYVIVKSKWFMYVMLFPIILNAVVIILDVLYDPEPHTELNQTILIFNQLFCVIFLAEIILKLSGLGIKTYLKSCNNVLDLIIFSVSVVYVILHYLNIYHLFLPTSTELLILETVAMLFPLLRLVRFCILFKDCIPRIVVLLDSHMNAQLRRSYDVGKGFVTGEEELLKMLVHIVDNKNIYMNMKDKIEDDRLTISKKLGIIQRDYPEIAVSVKTRQAIRTVLNKLEEAVQDLKNGGLLDDFEYMKCMNIVERNMSYLRTHCREIESCPPHVLLQEVPWIAGDSLLEAFLFEKARPINFNYGEVILGHGTVPESLYIILYGLVKLEYVPSERTLKNLKTYGALPNVDYFTTLHFDERQDEFVLPGNVVGELGILTGRTYDAAASCETSVQAYEISLSAILEAMDMAPDSSTGLRARMWKAVALRVAHVILTNTPHYQSWSQDDIKYHLERAFVPTLSQDTLLTVTELIEDILLIEGQVMDANSNIIYYAPCYIPRTIQKLIFPRHNLMNANTVIETRLLIIPVKHCDEVDVFEDGRGLNITSSYSARCLQHAVQNGTAKIFPQRMQKKGYGKQWSGSTIRSRRNVEPSEPSNFKPPDESRIYEVYSASLILSETSERLQNIIEASSLGSLSYGRNDMSYPLLEKRSDSKSRKVTFGDERDALRSDNSLDQSAANEEQRYIGSNGLPSGSTQDSVVVQSTMENSDTSAAAVANREAETASQREVELPFKRVFMPNITETQEDDST